MTMPHFITKNLEDRIKLEIGKKSVKIGAVGTEVISVSLKLDEIEKEAYKYIKLPENYYTELEGNTLHVSYSEETDLEKATKLNQFGTKFPQLKVGDIVPLSEVWDGNGNIPEESYSYQLSDTDWINYEFEAISIVEEVTLDTIVKVTNIEII